MFASNNQITLHKQVRFWQVYASTKGKWRNPYA